MARRTFFAFHFDHDIFRVNQVRNANVVAGTDRAGFYDHSEYEEAKKYGGQAIRNLILRHLENTTVTVVLIGTYTASRAWVQFEIEESVKRKNGLLGIRIHHLTDSRGYASQPGPVPVVQQGVEFPVYTWDSNNVPGFATVIEEAGKRSDALRRPPPGGQGFSFNQMISQEISAAPPSAQIQRSPENNAPRNA